MVICLTPSAYRPGFDLYVDEFTEEHGDIINILDVFFSIVHRDRPPEPDCFLMRTSSKTRDGYGGMGMIYRG